MEIGNITPYIPTQDNTSKLSGKLTSAYTEKDDAKLKETCKEFESLFINMMMKEMRKTVPESELLSSSFATDTYQEMLDEEISKAASKGNGIGIADAMYRQISAKLKNTYKVANDENKVEG